MSNSLYAGEWFLPNSALHIPGRLIFDDQSKIIVLELFGNNFLDNAPVIKNDPNRDKKYNSPNHNEDYSHSHPLIQGISRGSNITLYNCRIGGLEDIGKEMHIIKYRADFALFGAHLNSSNDSFVKSSTFIFPYLSSWYDGWESINKLQLFEDKEFSISDSVRSKNETEPIQINENLSIHLFDTYNKSMKEVGVHHELRYQKYIQFQYGNPVTFTTMRKDAFIFSHMLEFCLGNPINCILTEIGVDKEAVTGGSRSPFQGDPLKLPIGNYTLHKGKDVKKHSQHQNYILISRWNMKIETLNAFIKKWYANESIFAIYDFYLDSNNWFKDSDEVMSNVMFNNRFLNIVQGLEAYFRKFLTIESQSKNEFDKNKKDILSAIKDPHLKHWFNDNFKYKKYPGIFDKLKKVIESVNEIIVPIFEKNEIVDFFPKFSKAIRNNLSHGLNDKTFQGDALNPFFNFGQILLAICILKTLGVQDIGDKIVHYDRFARNIQELKRTKLEFVNTTI